MRSINERVDVLRDEIKGLAHQIHEDPELGMQEFHACDRITKLLEKYGFTVEHNICGMETAFVASYKAEKPGETVGFLAEYDALKGMGHACGHNMIAGLACCAAIALKDAVDEYGGEVRVIGSPAEETYGGKMQMSRDGIYDDLTVAMMGHPFGRHAASGSMFAIDSIRFEFFGKAAHAAGDPENGINALNAAIETFNNINALRQHIIPTAKVSGIITNGGTAANIVPDYASCDFYPRADTSRYLHGFSEKIRNCGRAAALATGARVEITNFEGYYDDLHTNETLSKRSVKYTKEFGVTQSMEKYDSTASSDIGNVSYRCPSIHQWFDVTNNPEIGLHTEDFCICTDSDYGYEQLFIVAKAFVKTAEDVLTDPEFVSAIRKEFDETTFDVRNF